MSPPHERSRSLATRLIGWQAAALILALGVAGVLQYRAISREAVEEVSYGAEAVAQAVRELLAEAPGLYGSTRLQAAVVRLQLRVPAMERIEILDRSLHVVACSDVSAVGRLSVASSAAQAAIHRMLPAPAERARAADGGDIVRVVHPIEGQYVEAQQSNIIGALVLDTSLQRATERLDWAFATTMVQLALLLLGFAGLKYAALSRWVLRRIDVLASAAERVGKGDVNVRVDAAARDEIGSLARSFNVMAQSLEDAGRDLRENEARFRAFVESTSDWVWSSGTNHLYTYSNSSVTHALGRTPEELVGRNLFEYAHVDDIAPLMTDLPGIVARKSGWSGLVRRAQHRDGTWRYLESSAVSIVSPDGSWGGFRGTDRDVTERMQVDRMKSDFVSFASHQLRTPLSGMRWMLELVAELPDLPREAREYLVQAQASSERLAALVNDLLDVGRLESGSMVLERESVDLAALTRHVAAEFAGIASEKQQHVSLALPQVALTTGDPQMLRQVIVNLFSNALKYTPSGGRVDVSLTTGEDLLMWQVRDTGIGIPMAAQSRLFEKFFRADNAALLETDGTGLGLHLAQLILGRSGDRIWCESEEGVGATFIFTLPAEQAVHA